MAADPDDDFSKFFLPDEWGALSPKERYQHKLLFLIWLSRSAEADAEDNKPEFMKKYDVRRLKILAERHESLTQTKSKARGKKGKGRKRPESDPLPYQEVLKGFSELEISEAQAAVLPLQKRVQRCLDEFDSSDSDVSETNIYKKKYRLRRGKRVNYNENNDEERDFDEFIYCPYCDGYYLTDFCLKHPLLIIPDDKVSEKLPGQTMAELTCPSKFLKIAPSRIPGAGLGVFTRCHLPRDVRFGPNRGVIVSKVGAEGYTWQTSETSKKKKQLVDSASPEKSNWLRYFNCARSIGEQNTTVFQYQGELYYRTLSNVPPDTELLIFYGMEYAKLLGIDMERYHLPLEATTDNDEKQKYTCDCCQLTFSTQQRLDGHRTVCGKLSPSIIAEDIYPPNGRNTSSKYYRQRSSKRTTEHVRLTCNVCQKIFSKNHLFQTHMKLHGNRSHVVTTTDCNKSTLATERQAGLRPAGNNQHVCQVCLKTLTSKNDLTGHMRIHTKEKSYICKVCDKGFSVNGSLTRHMRTHTGDKPYICDVCDNGFSVKSNLTTHMRTHTGDKPYICDVCDKGFSVNGSLTTHMRTHTGDKPYICEVCNKGFTNSSHLTTHMRTHTGDKPYVCEVCDTGFTQSSDLTKHMRTHTGDKPYICDVCDNGFSVKSNLTTHMRTHTGDKPYICDVCDKGFTNSSGLTTHMRTHTGERPYKCNVCSKDFTARRSLFHHMQHLCKSLQNQK